MSNATSEMVPGQPEDLPVHSRYIDQNARSAIQDVYDALVELITNADDAYQLVGRGSDIHIEIERRRRGEPSLIRVRDFGPGMTLTEMRAKLRQLGARVSGMEKGRAVRGTNSRGAKDVAVLGGATFESIAGDGYYHKSEITKRLQFVPFEPSRKPSPTDRVRLGIEADTGTLVTLFVDSGEYAIPQHDNLSRHLGLLVPLRGILTSRRIVLRDLNKGREDVVRAPRVQGRERLKETFDVPGFPGAVAKLVLMRTPDPIESAHGNGKFRLSGVTVQSQHAIHEATYFDADLENDPHAHRFFGQLKCSYIDTLWNDYDNRYESGEHPTSTNPCPIVDPLRKLGLRRDHPFTKALYGEALKRLRPLVQEEKKQAESNQSRVESTQTRKRLDALGRAAQKFMQEELAELEESGQDSELLDNRLSRDGFSLSPPFTQIVRGHSSHFWLNIDTQRFPGISSGDTVQITCMSEDVSSKKYAILEHHATQGNVLRAKWLVKGVRETAATGIQVRIGPIVAESAIEIFASEKSRYADVVDLMFTHKRHTVVIGNRKHIVLIAPFPGVVNAATTFDIKVSDTAFEVAGVRRLEPRPDLGVAVCKLVVTCREPDKRAMVTASLGSKVASTELLSTPPLETGLHFEIKDLDFGNQRYKWEKGVLLISARHPTIKPYLGAAPPFAGQEKEPFRVLLAEIVSEAICQRVLSRKVISKPEEYRDADWDAYYADYTKLVTKFSPVAHSVLV